MQCEIKCPILKKICETDPIYDQRKTTIKNKEIITTTCFRNNKRCIIYICGFDDYFYYHHVVEEYPDLDFIAIDLPGFGYNKGYYFDNHLTEMDLLCECISETIKIYCSSYENVSLMGFSMGGHVSLYYTWLAERNTNLFLPDELLLISPLVNFYTRYPVLFFIGAILSRISYLISSQINMRPSYFDIENNDMLELEDIYSSEKLSKYEIDDFDVNSIGGYHPKPFSNGTIVTVLNNMNKMINSNGIATKTICVCSTEFGNEPLKQDCAVHPDDILSYIDKICTNVKIQQFECGHQPLKQPFYTGISFIDVCNCLFDK